MAETMEKYAFPELAELYHRWADEAHEAAENV